MFKCIQRWRLATVLNKVIFLIFQFLHFLFLKFRNSLEFRNCYLFSFLYFQAEVSMISWIICTWWLLVLIICLDTVPLFHFNLCFKLYPSAHFLCIISFFNWNFILIFRPSLKLIISPPLMPIMTIANTIHRRTMSIPSIPILAINQSNHSQWW